MRRIKYIIPIVILSLFACAFKFPEETDYVRIIMVGDDLLHTPVYNQGLQSDGSYDMNNIFVNMLDDTQSADIAIINQETIFVEDKSKISSYPMFGSPVETADAINNAGFDVVCHATNHAVDKKLQGIQDTLNYWDTNYPNIITLGIHSSPDEKDVEFLTKNNITFSFVNYTYGLNGLDGFIKDAPYAVDLLSDTDIEDTMKYAKENSEFCIAILHAGEEYVYEPTNYQKENIEKFIDLGADVVICMHPHVIEPYGLLTTKNGNTGLVYYSLGNFVSAQTEVPRVLGGMADFTIAKNITDSKTTIEIYDFSMIPLVTHQEKNNYTVYRLDKYPDELVNKHNLVGKGFSKQKLYDLYDKITVNKMEYRQNIITNTKNRPITKIDLLKFVG